MSKTGLINFIRNILIGLLITALFFGALESFFRIRLKLNREKGFYSRGKTYSLKKTSPIRIVTIGASTTYGSGVGANQTFSFYLEKLLNDTLGKNTVEVLNSGVCGLCTEGQRDLIEARIGDQEVDYIMLVTLYNHFSCFFPTDSKTAKIIQDVNNRVKVIYHWDKMPFTQRINVFLMLHSHFYEWLREKIELINKRDLDAYYKKLSDESPHTLVPVTYKTESDEEKDKVLDSFVKRFNTALEDMITAAGNHNVKVIMVIPWYPYFGEALYKNPDYKQSLEYFRKVFDRGAESERAMAEKYGLILIDMEKEFDKAGASSEMFLDSIHLTPKGHLLFAEIAARQLAPYIKTNNKNISEEQAK